MTAPRATRTIAYSKLMQQRAEAKRQRRIERNRRLANQQPVVVDRASFESMTVTDLLALAKVSGLKATTKTRKADLVEMLVGR